jgi:flagellar biosynthesis/type III secretory pathway chaperone
MTAQSAASAGLTTLTRQLLATLRAERKLHDDLLRLTAAEREAIVAPSALALPDGPLPLETIVGQKERLIARLTAVEQARATLSGALAAALGLPRDARLADLLPRLGPTAATALQAERTALLSRAQALADANAANAELLTNALGATRATLGYLRALQGTQYYPDGRLTAPPSQARRFDQQA